MNRMLMNKSEKSYIKHLESELMAQRQTTELYRDKVKGMKEEENRLKKNYVRNSAVLANVNHHLMNFENKIFGAEETLKRIRKAFHGDDGL